MLAGCGLSSRHRPQQPEASPGALRPGDGSVPPHYIVFIILQGGFDSVLTVDAKDPATAGDIDTGYRADERLRGTRRLYGPLIGGLLRHDDDLCLVHGVRCDTVAHDKGAAILYTGHQKYTPSMPPFADAVGELLPGGAPIPHLHIDTGVPTRSPPELNRLFVPENPLANGFPPIGGLTIDATTTAMLVENPQQRLFETPSWLDELRALQREEARYHMGSRPEELAAYEKTLEQAGHLQRLMATADRATALRASLLGPGLQLSFHALRNNHARFITVNIPMAWLDSHTENLSLQTARTLPILEDISHFVDMLKRERNAFGTLFEQTTIVLASELGRYPKLNVVQGKDHWPENSWILLGRGLRRGVTVGATDRRFQGTPVDYRTGRTDTGERRHLTTDSLFATLVHLAGGDPTRHGYEREAVLQCILA